MYQPNPVRDGVILNPPARARRGRAKLKPALALAIRRQGGGDRIADASIRWTACHSKQGVGVSKTRAAHAISGVRVKSKPRVCFLTYLLQIVNAKLHIFHFHRREL